MNIIVCIKEVCSIEGLKLNCGDVLNSQHLDKHINLFDVYAIECALSIKDQYPETKVILLSVGAESCRKCLVEGLSMGADKAYFIDTCNLFFDALAISDILKHGIKAIEELEGEGISEMILLGSQSTDGNNGIVPYILSNLLSRKLVSYAAELCLPQKEGPLFIQKRKPNGFHKGEYHFPLIISATKPNHEVRYPTFKRIYEANKMDIPAIELPHIKNIQPSTGIISVNKPGRKSKNAIIADEDTEEATKNLLSMLREDKIFSR